MAGHEECGRGRVEARRLARRGGGRAWPGTGGARATARVAAPDRGGRAVAREAHLPGVRPGRPELCSAHVGGRRRCSKRSVGAQEGGKGEPVAAHANCLEPPVTWHTPAKTAPGPP